jgi:putative membrane-bound dehydrogenase-like protein
MRSLALLAVFWMPVTLGFAAEPASLKLLFLGDNGAHRPADRFAQLQPVLAQRGIEIKYTDDVAAALAPDSLKQFDGLILYANIDRIEAGQATALLDYVASGKAFVPLHCATFCFRNSPEVVALMGGQFQRHGGEVFTVENAAPEHPIMKGYRSFESWDETYVHTKHNEKDRTVLEYRVQGAQAQGQTKEPWTWVRTHGKGRVFYTAWGHDQRTWGNPGFQELVERGILWACGQDAPLASRERERPVSSLSAQTDTGRLRSRLAFEALPMTPIAKDLPPFEYVDVGPKIPNYTRGPRWGVQGQAHTQMQKPLAPAESMKHYSVPEGFHLELFASEPDLGGKPIAMTWDEHGRLWVCETYDYPNELQRENRGRDRIRICEDTDGDGKADKFTVFAEDLSIPTSIAFHRSGAIVQNGSETLYLKDTNGDDQADVREVLITGWAMNDTHGGVSNFQYGLDNWVWAMQGYNNSRPRYGDDQGTESFRQGFFRFKVESSRSPGIATPGSPRVSNVEFLRSTDNNTWGFGMSEEGIIFGSTANRNPSVYMAIPNRYYERVRGWSPEVLRMIADTHLFKAITDNVRQVDQFGGYTAGAGHALYTARTYPETFWNRTAFVCEPTGHLVGTFALSAQGSDFSSTSPMNLVASDDEWAAPIMAEVGPDGNVWICDWYNFIVQHNPTPQGFRTGRGNAYESELRDKKYGRIYRLVYDSPKVAVTGNVTFAGKPVESGAIQFDATDAKQPTVAGEIKRGRYSVNVQPGDANVRFTAGAALAGNRSALSIERPQELVAALTRDNLLWRRHAQRLLVERGQTDVVPELLKLVGDTSVDEIGLNVGAIHALWTLHGLGAITPDQTLVMAALTGAVKHRSAGVRRNAVQVLPAAKESEDLLLGSGVLFDADAQVRLAAILALADLPASETAGKAVAELLRDPSVPADRWLADAATSAAAMHAEGLIAGLVDKNIARPQLPLKSMEILMLVATHVARSRPDAETIGRIVHNATDHPGVLQACLLGLARGWQRDHRIEIPADAQSALLRTFETTTPELKGAIFRLAPSVGVKGLEKHVAELTETMLQTITSSKSSESDRIARARDLVGFQPQSDATVEQLLKLITPQTSAELATGLVLALSESQAPKLGELLVARSAVFTPAVRAAALRVLLARPQTTEAFLKAVEDGQLQLTDLSLDQKQALANHPDQSIRRRAGRLLSATGGLPNPDRQKVLDELHAVVEKTGDPAAGKEVFKKQCAKCHTHSGEGTRIGPDLTGMAVHPKHELLIHILDPSRSVEGNFRVYTVATTDGRVITGMLASESKTAIEIIDTEAKRHAIPRDDIDELAGSAKSVMPEGFEKQATPVELADLLEFLTQKGKYVPLDLRKVATTVSTRGMFISANAEAERLIFSDWSPKTVGDVPFVLVDPQGDRVPNVVLLYSTNGTFPRQMPRSVSLVCNMPAKAIHLLSGVGGWAYPYDQRQSVSMIVRLKYADGQTEDHELKNGVHFADYIRVVDVPESKLAFRLRGQQIRYLAVTPKRDEKIEAIDLVKGPDATAPVVMAVTVEPR